MQEVVPDEYNVRTTVHEYGGGAWTIAPSGKIIFANFADQAVYYLEPGTKAVSPIVKAENRRFADFDVHPVHENLIIAIQENHEIDTPDKVVNSLVLIDAKSGEIKQLVGGSDFYTTPRFDPEGKSFAWLEWNHPEMPWTGAILRHASFDVDAREAQNPRSIVTTANTAASEPRWGKDGTLYFLLEESSYRQVYKWRQSAPQVIPLKGLEQAEFGGAEFILGSNTYALLSPTKLVAAYTENGASILIQADLDTNEWKCLDLPIESVTFDAIWPIDENSFLVIGATAYEPKALYRVDLQPSAKLTKLRDSSDEAFDSSIFSKAEHIFAVPEGGKSEDGVHGIFYPPHNPDYKGLDGTKPPLIILSHGGPTSHFNPALTLTTQYWTSRGYAFFLLNYRGSSGHGRIYREALNSNWGIYDAEDAVNAASYLAKAGKVDGTKVGIQGGSAGGYCVLQCMHMFPKSFASAISLYGISSLHALIATTHKFEARYMDRLLFKDGQSQEERDAIVKDRSALTHVDKIETPLLLLHGREDKVVPLDQAELIRDAMKKRGRQVQLVVYEGEGHGFRKLENVIDALAQQEKWWRKTLVRE